MPMWTFLVVARFGDREGHYHGFVEAEERAGAEALATGKARAMFGSGPDSLEARVSPVTGAGDVRRHAGSR
jgi:hypothetical protein